MGGHFYSIYQQNHIHLLPNARLISDHLIRNTDTVESFILSTTTIEIFTRWFIIIVFHNKFPHPPGRIQLYVNSMYILVKIIIYKSAATTSHLIKNT